MSTSYEIKLPSDLSSATLALRGSIDDEEILRRQLLLNDTIVLMGNPPDDVSNELSSLIKYNKLIYLKLTNDDLTPLDNLSKISKFYTLKMLKAFAQRKVITEWHEAGHRIAYAWDDGSAVFPPRLVSIGPVITFPAWYEKMFNNLDDEINDFIKENNGIGAEYYEQDYVSSAYRINVYEYVIMSEAIKRMNEIAPDGCILNVITEDPSHVKWFPLTINIDIELDINDKTLSGHLLSEVIGAKGHPISLSSIPIEDYLDILERLKESRRSLSQNIKEWTFRIETIQNVTERKHELFKIKRTEINPALLEYRESFLKTFKITTNSLTGDQLGALYMSGLMAAAFLVSGEPVSAAIQAALATAGSATSFTMLKELIKKSKEKRKHWSAICFALHDEVEKYKKLSMLAK